MSNVHRLLVTDRIFFVTVNLHRNLVPLSESELDLVLSAFHRSSRKLGFLLPGYVLMPDHWHAVIGVNYPLTTSRAVQGVKWTSARWLNRLRGTSGPVWQHQFWDRFVRHRKELGQRLEYMHWNPVKRNLVSRPEEWKWSSYCNYSVERSQLGQCPIQVDYVEFYS